MLLLRFCAWFGLRSLLPDDLEDLVDIDQGAESDDIELSSLLLEALSLTFLVGVAART